MPYALAILWRDRGRYLPAVCAVAFSAVLIAVQGGLVLGLLLCTSALIDHAAADIWVMAGDAVSTIQAHPIPEAWRLRLDAQPEIAGTEIYLLGTGLWHKPGQGSCEACWVAGVRLDGDSLGAVRQLTPEMRARLTEPGTVVVDEWDLATLGLRHGVGDVAEINQRQVRVVGTVRGFQGYNFVFVLCSLETARLVVPFFGQNRDQTLCVLAHCCHARDADAVVQRLRTLYPDMGVYTSPECSRQAQVYWLVRSKGGIVMVCTVVLSLLVGLVVTSQTLYAAVSASVREYAVLDALGLPRRRLVALVLAQSLWIGAAGVALALPVVFGLSGAALLIHTTVRLPAWLVLGTSALTLGMALLSGVWALRSLRQVEPATLLR
jgi:putative ABC transport system permease protein